TEEIVAEYLLAEDSNQYQQMNEAIGSKTTVKDTITSIIDTYTRWVTQQPDLARFMFNASVLVSSGPHGQQLENRNKAVCSPLIALFKQAHRSGEIHQFPPETIASILEIGRATCRESVG